MTPGSKRSKLTIGLQPSGPPALSPQRCASDTKSRSDALVADGALSANVAVEIGTAFQEATDHLSGRFVSCYAPQQPGEISPRPTREELTLQAAALSEMAQRSDIDPGTVAKAQATLERDMAWLAQFRATQRPDDVRRHHSLTG